MPFSLGPSAAGVGEEAEEVVAPLAPSAVPVAELAASVPAAAVAPLAPSALPVAELAASVFAVVPAAAVAPLAPSALPVAEEAASVFAGRLASGTASASDTEPTGARVLSGVRKPSICPKASRTALVVNVAPEMASTSPAARGRVLPINCWRNSFVRAFLPIPSVSAKSASPISMEAMLRFPSMVTVTLTGPA